MAKTEPGDTENTTEEALGSSRARNFEEGRELLSRAIPALEVWSLFRKGTQEGDDTQRLLAEIKEFLK